MALSLHLTHADEHDLERLLRRIAATPGDLVSRPTLALKRSWHVLHGLFAGAAWEGPRPAATLLAGGREIGPDLGHGPARLASLAETRAFAAHVAPLCPQRLKAAIDPKRVARTCFYMADDAGCPDRFELADAVESDLPALKSHLAVAASHGHGLLLWMA